MIGYLTTSETAKSLHVTARRVRQLCQSGELDAEKFSRLWLVPSMAIEKYQAKYIVGKK